MITWSKRLLVSFLLVALLTVSACQSAPPSRFDTAQEESSKRGATAVEKEAVRGGQLNRFFPQGEGDYQVVYAQEKRGFAEAKLKRNGEDLAVMSISDITNNPTAATKFQTSSEQVKGYPAAQQGSTGTAVLVGDRFQVKVLSRNPEFNAENRRSWLEKFDLNSLAQLQS